MSRLKKDMEVIKKKNTEEKQKAERIAQGQRDALEREMKQKMENSEQEVRECILVWLCDMLVWSYRHRSKLKRRLRCRG